MVNDEARIQRLRRAVRTVYVYVYVYVCVCVCKRLCPHVSDTRRQMNLEAQAGVVVNSRAFFLFFPCNHIINIKKIIFFFRRSKRQRNF
jgi:hypothetical protein